MGCRRSASLEQRRPGRQYDRRNLVRASGSAAAAPSLLLKLLFTNQPLSIQVHPDDAYAQSIGLPNGKTEAWYVLSAAPEAKVALGLKRRLTPQQLRQAIDDGSISDLVVWQAVSAGDTIFVPAGTIHAIGAGLVIAEIQQRSDATFRLFDHGRGRELHIDNAIAVADAGPADVQVTPISAYRRANASGLQSSLHVRKDRSGAEFRLVSGSETRDLASRRQRQCIARIVRRRDGRCRFRAVGPRRHSRRRAAWRARGYTGVSIWQLHGRTHELPEHCSQHGVQSHGNNSMRPLQRVAFIGNHLPRRCGIATFTHDLHRAVSTSIARIWRPASSP